jgi:peptide/nickel transport system substrate-binding protein
MNGYRIAFLSAALLSLVTTGVAAQSTLRIGLAEDPDALDPTLARSFVGRVVFAGLCDKLFDITPDMKIVPQLATGYEWSSDSKSLTIGLRQGVKFQDGEPFNAEAVKFSIERHLTMPGSNRKGEISAVQKVEVVDDHTVTVQLSAPFAPLLAQLTDRAGMMVSPKAAKDLGDKFGTKPVCAGPYKFVERIAQDRIVLEKWADYWDKDNVKIDRVVYQPIPDSTVRLANLRSGQLDFIERVAATDVAGIKSDKSLQLSSIVELGYVGITINLNAGELAKNPLGQDARVRQALELSIDRDALNQVVFNGEFLPGNQYVSPQSPYYAKGAAMPKRDVAKAKALLKEAGQPSPSFTLMLPNGPENERVAQVIQSMAQEVGFDIKLQVTEFARALDLSDQGNFQAFEIGWSGRTDPDGNIYLFLACDGSQNNGKYCNPTAEAAIKAARTTNDMAERLKQYGILAQQLAKDDPIIYLYHRKWIYAFSPKLKGFVPVPDGLVRVKGLTLG